MLGAQASYGHNSFIFNRHLSTVGANDPTYAQNTYMLTRRRIEPSYRDGRDAYQLATGGALGRVHKGLLLLRLWGKIIAPPTTQDASIADMERALKAAFDPDLCYLDSPSTEGAYAFDFYEATTDTTTYPSGYMGLRYYVRPAGAPTIDEDYDSVVERPFALALIAADPRCYEQTQQTLALTPASPSGNVVNRGTAPAPLKATIVMSAAGASNFTISDGTTSFVLDLSGRSAAETVVVVMETCGPYGRGRYITVNGTETFSLKTSAAGTWLKAPVGTTGFSIANTTGVTSCTLSWHSARA